VLSRTRGWRNASQRAGAAAADAGKSLIGKPVELAGLRFFFNLIVKTCGSESLEPCPKTGRVSLPLTILGCSVSIGPFSGQRAENET
jgi:hypothetical protein